MIHTDPACDTPQGFLTLPYWTEREVAVVTGLAVSTLQKLRVRGDGPPFISCGRRVMYPADLVHEWMRQRVRTSTSQPHAVSAAD